MKLSCHLDLGDFLSFKQKMPRALCLLFLDPKHVVVKSKEDGDWKEEGLLLMAENYNAVPISSAVCLLRFFFKKYTGILDIASFGF